MNILRHRDTVPPSRLERKFFRFSHSLGGLKWRYCPHSCCSRWRLAYRIVETTAFAGAGDRYLDENLWYCPNSKSPRVEHFAAGFIASYAIREQSTRGRLKSDRSKAAALIRMATKLT